MDSSLYEMREVQKLLVGTLQAGQLKIKTHQSIYNEMSKIFSKFANKLTTLSTRISEEIVTSKENDESVTPTYQLLSNSLLRIASCARRVHEKGRTEVLDPLKTFSTNYLTVSDSLVQKIDTQSISIQHAYLDLLRSRENYHQACEKLEKQKYIQGKTITKIEGGNLVYLDKLNQIMKKLTEAITSSYKMYLAAVEHVNYEWYRLRKDIKQQGQEVMNNEYSRLIFFRKSTVNSIHALEEFGNAVDLDINQKLEDNIKRQQTEESDTTLKREVNNRVVKLLYCYSREEFVTYDEVLKRRRRSKDEENSGMGEVYAQVKDRDKQLMLNMIKPWFYAQKSSEIDPKDNQNKSRSNIDNQITKEALERYVDSCKYKILSLQPYSFYFLDLVHVRISYMTLFHCKLSYDDFYFLLNAFMVISRNLDLYNYLDLYFLIKIMQISQRVMLKRVVDSNKNARNKPIELLSQQYGKNMQIFHDIKVLMKLLSQIQKKRAMKKKAEYGKGLINTFTKGFLNAMLGRRYPALTEYYYFHCVQQLTTLVANFSIPNYIILPFIKSVLSEGYYGAYDYLKRTILDKKDVEERQKLFYRQSIKQKMYEEFRNAVYHKRVSIVVLDIVAKHGFFSKEYLRLRLLCKSLKDIHLAILYKLRMPPALKWIHLVPLNQQLNYISLKQTVAEQAVPSAVYEIISLDVNRSLHLHGEYLNPTILHSLLRTYAFFHTHISYCQGMNYIAGYLYVKTRNEYDTYRIFEHLMENRFKYIFVNEFEVLKIKMYQFDRLLSIFHPYISEHFKRQMISPECFIVSWIITLFASSYQYTMESYLIDVLWYRFIIAGWSYFFRFVLWIFALKKDDLLELSYDKALHMLGDLGRTEMFLAGYADYKQKFGHIEDVHQGMDRYHVTAELLETFRKEYSLDN